MKDTILTILGSYSTSEWRQSKWGIFVEGKAVFISGKNVYASEGIAKKQIINACFGRFCKKEQRAEAMKELNELIKKGIIEIRKL